MTDGIDHPDHYNQGDIECIDALRAALTPEEFKGFCKGNGLKYLWRARHKGKEADDHGKAVWYSHRLQELPQQHPDDAAVERFAQAMSEKLAAKRKEGRSGWDDPAQCDVAYLAELLAEHLYKRNPGTFVDIANFCMMLHERGAPPELLARTLLIRGDRR